jgi:hypothetical protein
MARNKQTATAKLAAAKTITIAKHEYGVPTRYAEGHVLTAGEAAALNQTFWEAIRNNLSRKAKEGKLGQTDVDTYAAGFAFGQRTGGFASDPIETMALTIARRKVKAKGLKAAQITPAAKDLLASEAGEAIRTAAATLVQA